MRDDACRISVVGSSHSAKSTYLIWTVAWHQLGNLGCLMTVCWIHSFSKNLHIIRGSLGSVLHACICRQNSWINWSLVLPPFQDFLNHYEDLHDYSGNHPFPTRNASGVGKACIYIYICLARQATCFQQSGYLISPFSTGQESLCHTVRQYHNLLNFTFNGKRRTHSFLTPTTLQTQLLFFTQWTVKLGK